MSSGNSRHELVKKIQKLPISAEEKMKQIRQLFQTEVTVEKKGIKCTHYERKCELLSPCCKQWIGWRFCHDENNLCSQKFDRFKITTIKCKECQKTQPVSNKCVECGITFAKSHCSICNVWTTDPIYHCQECGFCRVGKKEDYTHCNQCDGCFMVGHQCPPNLFNFTREDSCPVCFENLFSSKKKLVFIDCGHRIHQECLDNQLKNNNYKCPLCKKSVTNLTRYWATLKNEKNMTPMPEEYLDKKIDIVCNDCSCKGTTEFHVVGLECHHCGSFNTQRN